MTRFRAGCAALMLLLTGPALHAQEVIVFGELDSVIEWFESENWWGPEEHGTQLEAPYVISTGISSRWRNEAKNLPVPVKKELFYRSLLPLVLHANRMVLDRRERLSDLDARLAAGEALADSERSALRETASLLRIEYPGSEDAAGLRGVIKEALYKLDVIPPGLVLGQAAYESGYGTSRFAAEGNALFGQWTFGGEGLKPEQQRKELGDHRIAAFDWPFDSVRGYYINLSSHPAYEPFRKLRAQQKAAGKPLSSLVLAEGLTSYSERGQEYVNTLKGIIRVNGLDKADDAVLRDEPMRFSVTAENPQEADRLRAEIDTMRKTGELDEIIERMRLE